MRSSVKYLSAQAAGKNVYVGLSGGVDSAVTAALLQEAGARVTTVFIKGWYPPGMPCTWADDRRDAMRVAAHLRLPFITLDASKEYKEGVIDYLLREYKAGRTPNPDIMCNREVKFGAFYDFARAHGADFIATGHYARIEQGSNARGAGEQGIAQASLLRGADEGKDQSYFLWAIPKDALQHTLFPLGALHKAEVRELAAKYRLPNATRRDSQGICFLGSVSIEDFLTKEFGAESGPAVDEAGNLVGQHTGALLATLGQKVALANAEPGPWYVIAKDIQKNELVVSKMQKSSICNSLAISGGNFFRLPSAASNSAHADPSGIACVAQYRYHGPRIPGILHLKEGRTTATFIPHEPIAEPIASGQSLVLYSGEACIGGGIIG